MHAAAPMWRNGRRNGLKIRSREKRGMGSNPFIGTSKNVVLLGKNVRILDFVDCEQSRTKTHENTVYSSSNRQVNSIILTSPGLHFFTKELVIPWKRFRHRSELRRGVSVFQAGDFESLH